MGRNQRKARIASRGEWKRTAGASRNSKDTPSIEAVKFNKITEELHIYKQMVDLANHGFVIMDLKGNLLYVNDSFARMHGYDARKLLGKNLKIFHNAEQLKHVRAVFDRMKKTGKGLNNEELWRKRRDGTVFPTLTNNWLLRDKSGHPAMICATMVDISELRKREAELGASKRTLETMLNASGELIAMMDRNIKFVDLNEQMAEPFELPREQLIGRCAWDCMPPEAVAYRRPKAEQVLATGKPLIFFDEDGKGRVYSDSVYPVKGPDGRVARLVVFAKDVTEQIKAKAELEAGKKTLEAMLNATTDLVALMDKDLKYVDMNDNMVKGLRMPKERLIGRYSLDLMEPEVAALRRAKAKEVMATGKSVTFEHKSHGRIFSTSCYPVKGADGKITGIVIFAKDITQRKKAETKLEASKKTLETILNASGEAVAMVDRNINIIELNERMADLLGQPREKLIGRCAWDFMSPKQAALRRPIAEKILATGKPVTYLDEDYKGRIYNATGYPLKAANGKITGFVLFAKNITRQKKAEADLEVSKKTLETMLNASGELIAMLDRDSNFVDANELMADSMGLPRGKFIGRCAWDFMPPKVAAARRPIAERVMTTGKPITFFDDGGRGRIFSTSFYPLEGPDGKVTGMVVFAKDITQHKKAETELTHYREELFKLRRSAYLDLFGAVIGHELSQPLTIINLLMEEMACDLEIGSFEKEKMLESTKTCLREAKTAAETIHKMRKLTKQWIEGRIEHFSPSDVIREVVSSLELKATQAKMRIEVREPKFLPAAAGYRVAFEQIVHNLTENAIEAADQKKWHLLTISAEKTDRHIEMKFCDDCHGIAKENLGKIFEPFYSTKTNRIGKSLGLGLPIISRILTTMGGEIRVKSTAGKGTTFYVNWPLK